MAQAPKYLTGDPSAINAFVDQFDVRSFNSGPHVLVPCALALQGTGLTVALL